MRPVVIKTRRRIPTVSEAIRRRKSKRVQVVPKGYLKLDILAELKRRSITAK